MKKRSQGLGRVHRKRARERKLKYRPEGQSYWNEARGDTQRRDVVVRFARTVLNGHRLYIDTCEASGKPVYDTADKDDAA